MASWKAQIFKAPIKVVQQFRFGENATDNSIIMDVMELLLQNQEVNSYCIVSSDADYYNLALRLREYGKFVLGIGKDLSKPIWKNACNQFILIENITGYSTDKESESEDADNAKNVEEILEYAFNNSKIDNDGWISLSNFGYTIRSRYPTFDPRTYNHNNLLGILKVFVEEDYIRKDDCTPPNYWVRREDVVHNTVKVAGIVKRFMGHFGFIENEKGDYFFTMANIEKDSQDKKIRKGDRARFIVIKEPDASKDDLNERNGKAIDVEIIE
jgi:cold shock CspA family protein